jgi:hypothetical protein
MNDTCPSHSPRIDSNIWWRAQIMKIHIMQFYPASCHFISFGFIDSPKHPVLKYLLSLFHNMLTSWKTTFWWLSATTYSIHSQLLCVPGGLLLHPQLHDAPCCDDNETTQHRPESDVIVEITNLQLMSVLNHCKMCRNIARFQQLI